MQRTGTVIRGSSYGKGMSANDIEKDEREQIYAQRNPYNVFDDWDRLATEQANIGERWKLEKNTTLNNIGTLSEYKAGKTKELFDRIGKSGSRRRRRPSRKYKKSAKRVFRKKSRSTRRR